MRATASRRTIENARAGDLIPEIVARVEPSHHAAGRARPPSACPSCHSRVIQRGSLRRCPNTIGCPAQRIRAIEHFASRDAFDIDGLGPRTIELLVHHGLVRTAGDLFFITDDDLRALPRFGAVGATQLAARIDAARRVSLARFLFALGVPDVGAATAGRLAERFGTLAAIRRAGEAQLAATPEVGPSTARHIVEFFKRPSSQAIVDALLRRVTIMPQRAGAASMLAGRAVVFTGALDTMTRARAERLVQQHGGRPMRSVTRATSLVVTGSAPGLKLDRARALGLPILSERQFLRRFLRTAPPDSTGGAKRG